MLRLMGECGGCRAFRIGSDCSFDGGTGGWSGSGMLEFSPSGPSGPVESSTASNVVAFAATFPRVRGPLPAGDLGVADAANVGLVGSEGFDPGSTEIMSISTKGFDYIELTLLFAVCCFYKVCVRARA